MTDPVSPPLLEIEELRKEYELHGRALEVLKGVSLTLGQGEMLALVGKSGSGKSTLLHIAGTLDSPTSGTVRFEGDDLFAKTEAELARLRNQRIGFVFQSHHLLPEFTAIENVALPLLVARTPGATLDDRRFGQRVADGLPDWLFARRPLASLVGSMLKPLGYSGARSGGAGFVRLGTLATDATLVEPADPREAAQRALSDEVRDRAANLLAAVGLAHRLYHRPTELSGGEQQRVAIARALVMRPQLLLADEPTGNLDDATGEEIFRVLLDLNERHGISAVVVTHSERLASRMPRRLRLVDGRLSEDPISPAA